MRGATTLAALAAGSLFGAGLTVSQMTNPSKVIAFLDIFGRWDPSLAFVMAAAVLVTLVGYRTVLRRRTPLLSQDFGLPDRTDITPSLVGGAALFGIGWGLSGLCPGPAIASIGFAGREVATFVGPMVAGIAAVRLLRR